MENKEKEVTLLQESHSHSICHQVRWGYKSTSGFPKHLPPQVLWHATKIFKNRLHSLGAQLILTFCGFRTLMTCVMVPVLKAGMTLLLGDRSCSWNVWGGEKKGGSPLSPGLPAEGESECSSGHHKMEDGMAPFPH